MPLWLPEAAARIQPGAIDALLVDAGLAKSLTEARRLIRDGAIYLNNEKLTPPGPGFLPVIYDPSCPEAFEWIWEALAGDGEVSEDPGTGDPSRADRS